MRIGTAPPIALTASLLDVPGITPRAAEELATLGLTNLGRLLAHLPMRHERQEAESSIGSLEIGRIVSARGTVSATRVAGRGKGRRFEAVLMDDTGRLDLVWFNQPFLHKKVHPGCACGTGTRDAGQGIRCQPEAEGSGGRRAAGGRAAASCVPSSEQIRPLGSVGHGAAPPSAYRLEDHLGETFRHERAHHRGSRGGRMLRP